MKAIELNAAPLEAAFLQHAARRRIADPRAGTQRGVVLASEGVIDQRAHRFGGVAVAPERRADPVADLRLRPFAQIEAAGADDIVIAQDQKCFFAGPRVGGGDPLHRVGKLVRMRNAQCVLCDAAIIGERGYGFSVLDARRTQNKPLGLEDGGTVFAEGRRGVCRVVSSRSSRGFPQRHVAG